MTNDELQRSHAALLKTLGEERAADSLRETQDAAEIRRLKSELLNAQYQLDRNDNALANGLAYDLLELMGRKRRKKKLRELREVLEFRGVRDDFFVLCLLEDE